MKVSSDINFVQRLEALRKNGFEKYKELKLE